MFNLPQNTCFGITNISFIDFAGPEISVFTETCGPKIEIDNFFYTRIISTGRPTSQWPDTKFIGRAVAHLLAQLNVP